MEFFRSGGGRAEPIIGNTQATNSGQPTSPRKSIIVNIELDPPTWRRSTFCASSECVEIAIGVRGVSVRDSKQAGTSDVSLQYTVDEWRAFVLGVKAGEFDL